MDIDAVVTAAWPHVEQLLSIAKEVYPAPEAVAAFFHESGDWRLVTSIRGVSDRGALPTYKAVGEELRKRESDPALLGHLVAIDSGDVDAISILTAPLVLERPPRRLALTIGTLPEYRGAVVQRDQVAERRATATALESEVLAVLDQMPVSVAREARVYAGWIVDFAVDLDVGRVLVDVRIADRRNVRNRVREAAGLANVSESPVVLVMREAGGAPLKTERRLGLVPVLVVDWSESGAERLTAALDEARIWMTSRPN